jgi:hypothetical protein
MTISVQSLKGTNKAQLKKMVDEATKEERKTLDRRFARIVKEAIEESGDPGLFDAIANKIKARIL